MISCKDEGFFILKIHQMVPDIAFCVISTVLNSCVVLWYPAKIETLRIFCRGLRITRAVTDQRPAAHAASIDTHID